MRYQIYPFILVAGFFIGLVVGGVIAAFGFMFLSMLACFIAELIARRIEHIIQLKFHAECTDNIYVYSEKIHNGVNKWISEKAAWHEMMLKESKNKLGDAGTAYQVKVIPIYFQDYLNPEETPEEYFERCRQLVTEDKKKRHIKLNDDRDWYVHWILEKK